MIPLRQNSIANLEGGVRKLKATKFMIILNSGTISRLLSTGHSSQLHHLDLGSSSPPRMHRSVLPPVSSHKDGAQEPEKHIREIHPDSIFHALDAAIAFWTLIYIHLYCVSSCTCYTPAVVPFSMADSP